MATQLIGTAATTRLLRALAETSPDAFATPTTGVLPRRDHPDSMAAPRADAGRDPARFPAPDRFDIRRGAAPDGRPSAACGHLALGHGLYYCLGAPLARLEAHIAIRTLLERAPALSLDADPDVLPWHGGMLLRGPLRLPVRFGTSAC